ncbi:MULTISPECIES: hypothetical protein [Aeromonas]|jgi:hypothetical protein|uniref:hypothetical protein n=1 Tax=Aeromonas TaxID=642 RepID=UPI0005B7293A|nr:hypothetical protein RW26_09160 [Aeromonas sp. L_1B5_3]MBL0598309.1 hypothetical protein [Aeromonas jandaei]MBL0608851.1 hypothetical protein [Aeromonas jandaei]MBL0627314.1 hypothetical protein [Aeromonas jandaei]MBM0491766.1 hypothetical protein [Aeromonas jandaei]
MFQTLLLLTALTPIVDEPVPVQAAMEAERVCQQFVHVRLGEERQPDEIEARLIPDRESEWLVDGKVKGPEGPLLFACHLHQGERWELLNFSLWAPQPVKAV